VQAIWAVASPHPRLLLRASASRRETRGRGGRDWAILCLTPRTRARLSLLPQAVRAGKLREWSRQQNDLGRADVMLCVAQRLRNGPRTFIFALEHVPGWFCVAP
jgi:hypothetical protein